MFKRSDTMGRSLALRFGWRAGEEGKGGKREMSGGGDTDYKKKKKRDREEIKAKMTIEPR